MRNVRPGRRLAYSAIDIVVFTAITLGLASFFGWQPNFDFMQAYNEEQRDEYWNMLLLAVAIVSVASLTSHALYGKSIGKWIMGVRSVRLDGSPLGFTGALKRLAYILTLAALIFIPGPVAAFTLGHGTEWISIILLDAALLAVPFLAVYPWHQDRAPLLQPKFGVRTIYDVGDVKAS